MVCINKLISLRTQLMKNLFLISIVILQLMPVALTFADEKSLPSFQATSLNGDVVTSQSLIGQAAVLIVTPSRGAAADTRMWVKALRDKIDLNSIKVRDILCIDLPFFITEEDAIDRARQKIPSRFHDQTWLLDESILETSLGIPTDSNKAIILVLDSQSEITARVKGEPSEQSIEQIAMAVQNVTVKP